LAAALIFALQMWAQTTTPPPAGASYVIRAASLTAGSLQITGTRLAVVGDEVQLDLTVQTSGTFSYQIATATAGYPATWGN
jgi:hypothetical protein